MKRSPVPIKNQEEGSGVADKVPVPGSEPEIREISIIPVPIPAPPSRFKSIFPENRFREFPVVSVLEERRIPFEGVLLAKDTKKPSAPYSLGSVWQPERQVSTKKPLAGRDMVPKVFPPVPKVIPPV